MAKTSDRAFVPTAPLFGNKKTYLTTLPLSALAPTEFNPVSRSKVVDGDRAMKKLLAAIDAAGTIIQPIIVTGAPGQAKYTIGDGNRR